MIFLSFSVDPRIVLFFLLLASTMADPAPALTTTNDVPTSNTDTSASTCANTRTHRHHQSFKGQHFDLWEMVVTTNKLRAAICNKVAKKTACLVNSLRTVHFKHILKALSSGKDYKFTELQLKSIDQKDQIMYKIKYAEYSKHADNYQNKNIAFASSLLGQCDDSVLQQLADMKGHTSGQYEISGFCPRSTNYAVGYTMMRSLLSKSSPLSANCLSPNNRTTNPLPVSERNSSRTSRL